MHAECRSATAFCVRDACRSRWGLETKHLRLCRWPNLVTNHELHLRRAPRACGLSVLRRCRSRFPIADQGPSYVLFRRRRPETTSDIVADASRRWDMGPYVDEGPCFWLWRGVCGFEGTDAELTVSSTEQPSTRAIAVKPKDPNVQSPIPTPQK